MFDSIRMRHGLRWRGSRPGVAELRVWLRGILLAFCLLLLFGLLNSLDAATDRALFAERAAEIYGAKAKALDDCERGAAGYYYADQRAYSCGVKM